MATAENDHASGSSENKGRRTEEQRLNDAVAETSDQAGDKDQDEVEADLRSAMVARGVDPDDTSAMAAYIVDAVDESS